MNKKLLCLLTLTGQSLLGWAQTNRQLHYTAKEATLADAYYVERIPLKDNTLPEIRITDSHYSGSRLTISDSALKASSKIDIRVGVERKKSFAMVRIPAFRKNAEGQLEQLEQYTLNIVEKESKPAIATTGENLMRTTALSSVLAEGKWQKISVPSRGIYKVDYDFMKNTLGYSGTINSSSIRLFGNGGTMLYESNKVSRPDDLLENALDMYDGNDGVFGAGDYFLFYANGPMEWVKDSLNQQFHHRTNLYSDSSYYFISLDNGNGLRMKNEGSAGSYTTTVSSYNDYALHEKDLVNLGLFGKIWWGETFGFNSGLTSTQTFSFPVNNITDTVAYSYQMASAAIGKYVSNAASFSVNLNGQFIANHTGLYGIPGEDGENPGYNVANSGIAVIAASGTLNFTIDYQKYVSNAKGYLDFIEINTRRNLQFAPGTQLSFRDWRSVGNSSVAQFQIGNTNDQTKVWNVTNPLQPVKISGNQAGSTYSFAQDASQLNEYIVADNNFLTPKYAGAIANQNLHGSAQADYIIVAHPEMMDAANKLADFHRSSSHFNVVTVSTTQVYNEFSSGSQDIAAIRDFVKMFYERAGTDESKMPKYLLLLGQASFDYKNIIPNNAKIVPTFETEESLAATIGHCTDDFYAFLDKDENISEGYPLLDIGVGRIPATSKEQALAIAEKIIRYKSNAALGPWRINNIFIGDNKDDAGDHLADADQMANTIDGTSKIYKAQKVYLESLNIISTPGGFRCPEANKIVNNNVYKGAFLINYCGHGSIYSLAHERVVTQDDYNSWNNPYKMPIMITATCDFGRFDNPALQSAGEKIMLKSDGGAIALVTTTQVVYASSNRPFNTAYLNSQFTKKTSGGWNTFGDAFRIAKNLVISGSSDNINSRKFALLGDPALVPDFPRYEVKTDSTQELIDGIPYQADSIRSLGTYRIFGTVRNDNGMVMDDFNGKVNISFYDKPQTVLVPGNRSYITQNNIIYKGIATVNKGNFSFDFIVPKDINYEFGKGKISYYADNSITDASGADTNLVVGGFSDNASADNDGPVVRAFMNDSLFKDGGLTGSNSVLYAIITDKSGINVSGNFVGHDLSAVLDGVVEAPYILNDYYETAPNTYQRGFVNFPITGLTDGMHTLRIKAWDVFNNSGEGSVNFEVLNGKIVKLRNLYNYPNPFSDQTHFVFEHNHPNEPLTATIHIFNTTGALVRTLTQSFTPEGSNSAEVIWDGTGNSGEKLLPGVYPYRIRIATEKNIEDLGYQKVILVR